MEGVGGIEILNKKERKLVEENLSPDEKVEFCIVGVSEQSIIALQDRLLVVKTGMMAGTTFGGRCTSFFYRDITGIEVNTGMVMGVIEICTPSYQGTTQKDYWSQDKDRNPHQVSNCIPIGKRHIKTYQPYLDKIKEKIRIAKQVGLEQTVSNSYLADELEKLASLKASGILTEEEFLLAKKKLISL